MFDQQHDGAWSALRVAHRYAIFLRSLDANLVGQLTTLRVTIDTEKQNFTLVSLVHLDQQK